jgi:periplasmic divalent cation tolerance protein
MTDFRVCLVTVPDRDTGETLARCLLEQRLAACVNLVPGCRSLYWWDNAICCDDEVLMIVKTAAAQLDELTAHVLSNHPYACPEVVALPIDSGSPAYLSWLSQSLRAAPSGSGQLSEDVRP